MRATDGAEYDPRSKRPGLNASAELAATLGTPSTAELGALYQREAELVPCGVVERPPGSKPGWNFAFANTVVSVRV